MKRLVLFLLAGICLLACEKDNEAVVEPVPEPAPAPVGPSEGEDADTAFCEPVLAWGKDFTYVMEHQKQGVMTEIAGDALAEWSVKYTDARRYKTLCYGFNKGGLNMVYAEIEMKQAYKKELLDYLTEHYTPLRDVDWDKNFAFFIGTDGKTLEESTTVVGFTYRLGVYIILKYIPKASYQGASEPWYR